ncbi:MAG TPA: hypothetical protein VK721_00425 [Solirubrobacteraceae bacterium]|nr:hypothetical protein [Solirubrobacteraceae bacterium]
MRLPSRRGALAGLALVLVAIVVLVLVVADPFAGSTDPGGIADNATATSLATVARRPLSSQTPVSGTLGYAGASSIRVPAGTPPSAVQQAEQSVTASEAMLRTASTSLAADGEARAGRQATLSAAREKESVDCAGDGAAEAASAGSSRSGGESPADAASPGASGSGLCTGDVQVVSSDTQALGGAAAKLDGDRASLASAEASLARAKAAASAARASEASYGQSSTFTMLPAVGQVVSRGQTLYAISGRPVVLRYGSPATRALPLGSVVFEPGPVRVTSVTPSVGASVTPGPVLGITSTAPQVTIELSAAQQSSVKAGDAVTITLPDNQTTPGVVRSVGTVAKTPSNTGGEGGGGNDGNGDGGGGGEEGGPTIEVDVRPSEPGAIGHLDEAPVTVSITTASVPEALVVPVDALLALAGGSGVGSGGYALEVVEGRVHRLQAVSLGLFDDAEGLVQVSGEGLSAGERVVVPAT